MLCETQSVSVRECYNTVRVDYLEVKIQHFSHYPIGTSSNDFMFFLSEIKKTKTNKKRHPVQGSVMSLVSWHIYRCRLLMTNLFLFI